MLFHMIFAKGAKDAAKQKSNVHKDTVYIDKKAHKVKIKFKQYLSEEKRGENEEK